MLRSVPSVKGRTIARRRDRLLPSGLVPPLLGAWLALTVPGLAQPAPPSAEPRAAVPAPEAPPAAGTPSAPNPSAPLDEPTAAAPAEEGSAGRRAFEPLVRPVGQDPNDPFIPVDDPMLEPIPAPPQIIHTWQDALSRVRNQSPDLARARAQIETAQGRSRQVLSQSLPQLVGTGNANFHLLQGTGPNINDPNFLPGAIPNPRGNVSGTLSLRVPVFSMRTWYDHGTAKQEIKQAELQASDVERIVIGGLAESILSVVTAERLAEVTRVNLRSALSSLELNRKRARLGAANAVDVLRAEQEVARTRSQVIQSNETLRQAREALGIALGDHIAWGVPPEINMDQLRADAAATCERGNDVEARPDILAAKASADVAQRRVKSVDYSFLPTLEAQSAATANSIPGATATRNGGQWTIGAVLSWNLYDGGLRYGEKATNQSLFTSSQVDLADKTRRARLEVTQAVRGVDVAQSRLEVSKASYEISAQNARLARIRFVNGTGSSFDMIQTQSASQEANIDVTVKEFELLRAQIVAFLALASCDI